MLGALCLKGSVGGKTPFQSSVHYQTHLQEKQSETFGKKRFPRCDRLEGGICRGSVRKSQAKVKVNP